MDLTPYAFVDTETGGVEGKNVMPWEIAVLHRSNYDDTWGVLLIHISDYDPGLMTTEAAQINGFHQRWMVDDLTGPILRLPAMSAARMLENVLRGRIIVGSNPDFDRCALTELGCKPTWSHRRRDIPSMALGRLGYETGGLDATAGALEVKREGEAHTALSDALLARDCFLTMMQEARHG